MQPRNVNMALAMLDEDEREYFDLIGEMRRLEAKAEALPLGSIAYHATCVHRDQLERQAQALTY